MKLITKSIERNLLKHPIMSTENQGTDAEVIVKFFGGYAATWLVTEAEHLNTGDWLFYGAITLNGADREWGFFTLSDLTEIRFPPFGLPIERDMYLSPHTKVADIANFR